MTEEFKIKCINCNETKFLKYSTLWQCINCKFIFNCYNGMPRLYFEKDVGEKDKLLRNYFYNGLLGKFYQFLMPFLTFPARPLNKSWRDWCYYFITVFIVVSLIYKDVAVFSNHESFTGILNIVLNSLLLLLTFVIFYLFIRHPYFFFLFIIAIPVKISLSINKYQPSVGFQEVHKNYIDKFLIENKPIKILDISTGTGNSLYRHGWMKLNAEYTGLDLSETMLTQCQSFMSEYKVPIDLIIGDASALPFTDKYFDIVLNYGAINGYSDIQKALSEMSRVTKKGGLILFLDEQLYSKATIIEKYYFKKVLSSHNSIHYCPVDLFPSNFKNAEIYQVYEFYYICACTV